MNAAQQSIMEEIESVKAQLRTDGPYKFKTGNPATACQLRAKLVNLARSMASYDDRTAEMRYGRRSDPGGRSRSPSFGKFRME